MIEGVRIACEMETALPAAVAAMPMAGGRLADRLEPTALPFDRFCEDPALVSGWQRLEASASLPMQSHDFAAALTETLLAGAEVEVFFIRDGRGIAALLPLSREARRFGRWTIIGAEEMCEPDDALCRSPEAARQLAEAIVSDERAVELDRIPAGSPLIPALQEAMRGKGWVSVRPAVPSPTISLDSRWQDPPSCFNPGRRSDFRRAARKASELGEVTFETVSPEPAGFDALFDEAAGVEMRSWKREAGTAIAADRAKEDCFRRYFRSACEKGLFRIAFMRIGGRAVAMQMALEWQGRYWLFKIAFDEDHERCSPGTLLMLHSLGWAAKRELRAFELLGNVEPWIARFWTRERHDCVCLRAYPFNACGALAFACDAGAWLRKRLARADS